MNCVEYSVSHLVESDELTFAICGHSNFCFSISIPIPFPSMFSNTQHVILSLSQTL